MLPFRVRRLVGAVLLVTGALALVAAVVAWVGKPTYFVPLSTFALLGAVLALGLTTAGARLRRPATSSGARSGRIVLFEAPLEVGDSPAALTLTIRGARDAIERFIPLEEFSALFGGYVMWQPPSAPIPELPGEALGVWSRRTCSRFRRILRERGAQLEVRRERGPTQALARWSRSYARS